MFAGAVSANPCVIGSGLASSLFCSLASVIDISSSDLRFSSGSSFLTWASESWKT